MFTADVNQQFEEKETLYKQQVNKNVSFNLIKNKVFEIFYSKKDIETLIVEMDLLFKQTPTVIRLQRKHSPRNKQIKRGRDTKIYHHRAMHKVNF